jgi:hypothetical protein
VGARTVAVERKQPAGMRSPFGPRDKVFVMYDLRPVRAADTSYYRAAIKSGDVLVAEGAAARLESLARASLAAFEASGGDKAQALAEWRKQGLAAVADAVDPPQPDKAPPGALPPGDDTLKTAPSTGQPMIAIEVKAGEIGVLNTEGAVS